MRRPEQGSPDIPAMLLIVVGIAVMVGIWIGRMLG